MNGYYMGYEPKGVQYIEEARQDSMSGKAGWGRRLWKYYTRFRPAAVSLDEMLMIYRPDMVHSNNLMIMNRIPWVMDLEDVGTLSNFHYDKLEHNGYRTMILKLLGNPRCKRIMPHTEAAKRSIEAEFPEIKDKLEVVYPAIDIPKQKKAKHGGIKFLFVGNRYYERGCQFIEQAFKEIKTKHDVELQMVHGLPRDMLYNAVYPTSDVFLFLGHFDTFGFAQLEAMSFGMPVIGIDQYAEREIVKDGKTGFLLQTPFTRDRFPQYTTPKEREDFMKRTPNRDLVEQIVQKCSLLIKDTKLRKRMGENARKEIESGRFSIRKRNEKLKRIYEEATCSGR